MKLIEKGDKSAPLSGRIVKATSEEFAGKLNVRAFKATDGWFSRFKKKEVLGLKRKSLILLLGWKLNWMENVRPAVKQRYNADQIWNGYESGYYIRAFTFKNDHRKGTKKEKDHCLLRLFYVWGQKEDVGHWKE